MNQGNYFPTIRRRLEQIAEYGLPHVVEKDNTLPKPVIPIGTRLLDGKIQEIIVDAQDKNPFFPTPKVKDYGKNICSAAGYPLNPREITDFVDESRTLIDMKKVDIHGFYDPNSKCTHYFILPKPKK